MKNRESEEMYLETILRLKEKKGNVRSIDVAEELGHAKSSVSRAVHLLEKKGYIVIDADGEIRLTAEGGAKAGDIYDRHCTITKLLMKIGAGAELAEENACRIEHVISAEMFEIMKKFLKSE